MNFRQYIENNNWDAHTADWIIRRELPLPQGEGLPT